MTVTLDPRSDRNLKDVHRDLVNVVRTVPLVRPSLGFVVIDGKRTLQVQKAYFESGKSRTMNSRHLTGHAVDIAVVVEGSIVWEPWALYEELAEAMFQAAHLNGIGIEWGGHFGSFNSIDGYLPFRDGLHFQLPQVSYPAKVESPKKQAPGKAKPRPPRTAAAKPKSPAATVTTAATGAPKGEKT